MKLEKRRYDTYKKKKTKTKKNGVLRRKRDDIRYNELEADIHRYMRGGYNEDDYST